MLGDLIVFEGTQRAAEVRGGLRRAGRRECRGEGPPGAIVAGFDQRAGMVELARRRLGDDADFRVAELGGLRCRTGSRSLAGGGVALSRGR